MFISHLLCQSLCDLWILCRRGPDVVVCLYVTVFPKLGWTKWEVRDLLPNRATVIVIDPHSAVSQQKFQDHPSPPPLLVARHARRRGHYCNTDAFNQRNALVLTKIASFLVETLQTNRASTCVQPNVHQCHPPPPVFPFVLYPPNAFPYHRPRHHIHPGGHTEYPDNSSTPIW